MQTINEFKEFLTQIDFILMHDKCESIYYRNNVKIIFTDNNVLIRVFDKMKNNLLYEECASRKTCEYNQIVSLIGICMNNKIFDIEDCEILLTYF